MQRTRVTGRRGTWAWGVRVALAAAVAVLPPVAGASPAAAEGAMGLRIQGSTTFNARLLEPYRAEIEKRSGVKLQVVANKSIWGLVALVERRADMAMISARLSSELEALTKTAGAEAAKGLLPVEIARSRVAFAVHPANPVRRLADAAVRSILLGETRNWKDVGGPDLPIRVVATQDGGGTVAAVRAQLLDGRPIAAPDAIRLESADHVVKVVAQEPGAIAIAQLSLTMARGLPEIATDKPIEQLLCLVMRGEPTEAMAAFIEAARAVAVEKGL